MVLACNLKDIYEASNKLSTFSLPTYKGNQLEINYSNTDDVTTVYSGLEPFLPFAASELFYANITDSRRLTAENGDCKAVYEVTLNIEGSNWNYRSGDTIGIIPRNENTEVQAIIDYLNLSLQADLPYSLSANINQKGSKIPPHIPTQSTIRHVLTSCCDIRSVLKKLFLLALSRYTKDENERQILEYLCSKEGTAAYKTHVLNSHLCIIDLFAIFKSCRPPVEVLLAYLPRLLPRPYSIVNSGINNSNKVKICFSVVDLGNRKGLVTNWLEGLAKKRLSITDKMQDLSINNSESCKVPIYLRNNISGFALPENLETPLILIGPGTGVAPFIGFLEELQFYKEKDTGKNMGSTWIFFGCRNPKLDYIYEKELSEYLSKGTLSKLSVSFSRIEKNKSKYIQDALMQNGDALVKLIKENAMIFVCGDLKNMAAQVRETLVNCLVEFNSKTQEEAEKMISDMQIEKRYLVDMWS